MIVREYVSTRKDGVKLYETYSDAGFQVMNEQGVCYDFAIDVETSAHAYTETTTPCTVARETRTTELSVITMTDVTMEGTGELDYEIDSMPASIDVYDADGNIVFVSIRWNAETKHLEYSTAGKAEGLTVKVIM